MIIGLIHGEDKVGVLGSNVDQAVPEDMAVVNDHLSSMSLSFLANNTIVIVGHVGIAFLCDYCDFRKLNIMSKYDAWD